jgi:hypothetical protein
MCVGHDKEFDQIQGTALKAGAVVMSNAQGFMKGVKEGFDDHRR